MILQHTIPYDVHAPRPLPGIAPLAADDWLRVDDAFAEQMTERERLIADRRAAVIALDESVRAAAEELLDMVLAQVLGTTLYARDGDAVIRPDGRRVEIDRDDPMATLGRLVQEDFCILDKRGDEHVLLGAVLCFPASWSLDEKFRRPLIGIHIPVESYDANIARRVQRLFDGVQPERPLWRFNALWYDDPALHQPRREGERRDRVDPAGAAFLRSEMQTVRRLPQSRAVVFGIHTYVLARADVEQG
ncbi:DUF3445 domain-containing protein [Aquicoccus porphyridii]|uniref:DUF3445 domain-containing protein n=1 Tax=Aquicoccus porphyridii TaxID=1852029 RepID=A0A5A9ZU30_9RHOB|nr:DUF3445 domain-containing protein [Aquicoccus porphyridii]KAA0920659.1 DUF3445 domain-containing protein [Aquicoccus porphyridii]RAI56787.1 DUF3445 domain-containing protein [Rhodobacteraceae bacterium AsT-22]